MSRIQDLGKNNTNLPNLIHEYDNEIKEAEDRLRIRGKLLEVAQQEQCAWPLFYEVRKTELKSLVKYFQAEVARVRGTHVRRYTENYSRQLGDRAMNGYIDAEESYLQMNQLLLEVEELYDQYVSICEAFTKRGFALRDLTSAKIAEIHKLPI